MSSMYDGWKEFDRVIPNNPIIEAIYPLKVNAKTEDEIKEFDDFISKLVMKIGEVEKAKLESKDVWGYSLLHIVRASGARETWKTQEIFKTSMYGVHFNQWPTRKMKIFLGSAIFPRMTNKEEK
ncbi:hypothetical protein EKK58_12775 [Candidatus Dependentiae bacterium]|nr:MAG: hypothetical protein EKK58_12775 [Candidatus Dependentiae bacterium]